MKFLLPSFIGMATMLCLSSCDNDDLHIGGIDSDGLLDEARKVYPMRSLNSLNTVGFKEMFAYLDGEMDYDTAVARIKKNTRVYAKKQLTWLKRDPSVIHLDPSHPLLPQAMVQIGPAMPSPPTDRPEI